MAPLSVAFSNLSTGDFDTCSWNFGDGTSSSDCGDPSHAYADPGSYSVSLAVSGPGGSDTQMRTDYVTAYEIVEAGFSGEPTEGVASLSVAFTNLSSGDFDTCSWYFGDGTSSDDCGDPSHSYEDPGIYTVSLAVNGPGGSDTATRTDYVTAFEIVEAGFSGDPTEGVASLSVPRTPAWTRLTRREAARAVSPSS